eukprot:1250720-Rhodomonas_salina.4
MYAAGRAMNHALPPRPKYFKNCFRFSCHTESNDSHHLRGICSTGTRAKGCWNLLLEADGATECDEEVDVDARPQHQSHDPDVRVVAVPL